MSTGRRSPARSCSTPSTTRSASAPRSPESAEHVDPETGDVDATHETGILTREHVLDEAPERIGAVGLAGPPGVDADGEEPGAVAALRVPHQGVEAEPE